MPPDVHKLMEDECLVMSCFFIYYFLLHGLVLRMSKSNRNRYWIFPKLFLWIPLKIKLQVYNFTVSMQLIAAVEFQFSDKSISISLMLQNIYHCIKWIIAWLKNDLVLWQCGIGGNCQIISILVEIVLFHFVKNVWYQAIFHQMSYLSGSKVLFATLLFRYNYSLLDVN